MTKVSPPKLYDYTRVSLDLTPEEKAELVEARDALALVTNARFLRRACHVFADMVRLFREGYIIQAVKKGHIIQYHNLEVPEKPNLSKNYSSIRISEKREFKRNG